MATNGGAKVQSSSLDDAHGEEERRRKNRSSEARVEEAVTSGRISQGLLYSKST